MNKLEPGFTRRLGGEILRRLPNSRGWTILGHPDFNSLAVWVHIRSYLSEADTPPGFRIEMMPRASFKLCDDPRYVTLFVRRTDKSLAPKLYDLITEAQRRSLPWMTIGVNNNSDAIVVYEQDGTQWAIPSNIPALNARPLHLHLTGSEVWEADECLPIVLHARGESTAAALSVNLSDQTGFSKSTYHFVVRGQDGQPLGPGALSLDVRCKAGALDEIFLTPSGFASPVSEVEEWAERPRTEPEPVFHQGTVHLHLVYDRTTLDVDSWPLAYEALDSPFKPGEKDEASQAYTTDAPEPRTMDSWNLQLREGLAGALETEINNLHEEVLLYLWWFADRPREGIAPNDALPYLNKPYGSVGQCLMKDLNARLGGPDFEYASGLDLFDAVDEALEQIVTFLKPRVQARHEQHAVLIIGDSPPPPSKPGDMLWERLVSQPDRTNARHSPRFNEALETLRHLRVPVAWLFMRTSRSPSVGAVYRQYLRQFTAFQDLREAILGALQQLEGLIVEDCAGPEDLHRTLGLILKQMARDNPKIPEIHINKIVGKR
jgi:hypothetical protein